MDILKKVENVAVDVADAVLQVAVTGGTLLAEAALDKATGVNVSTADGPDGQTGIDISVGAASRLDIEKGAKR